MKPLAAAVLLALSAAPPAFAATTTFDFESVTSFASIADFYNGGTDGAGASGPDVGVSFGGDAIGLANDFQTYFSNAPSPLGVMTAVGTDAALNAAGGLANTLSFSYSSAAAVTDAVQVWSGLNGTGSLLASFSLAANAQSGCSDSPFCRFDTSGGAFAGIAHSITFGNAANVAAFDNVTVALVPEPATYAMMAAGLAGLAFAKRRRRG